jgi:hypothetical protein
MVIKTASPGVVVNEVDLTRGTSDAITTNIGAFAGPFARGPVGELVLINTEAELQRVFGDPTDDNYEYWWTISNFLEYGGVCYVVRCDDAVGDSSGTFLQTMKNATDEIVTDPSDEYVYVKNEEDFLENWYQSSSAPGKFIARNPGTWANGLAVAVIDHGADYQMSLKSTGIVTEASGDPVADNTAFDQSAVDGLEIGEYIKVAAAQGGLTAEFTEGQRVEMYTDNASTGTIGYVVRAAAGVYTILVATGTFTAAANNTLTISGAEESDPITAVEGVGTFKLYEVNKDFNLDSVFVADSLTKAQVADAEYGWSASPAANTRATSPLGTTYIYSAGLDLWVAKWTPAEDDLFTDGTNLFQLQAAGDWYTQQEAFAGVPWYRFASRPGTTPNALDRGALNDELNIIIYDATGEFTGTKGNTLESFFGVSKLRGAVTQEGELNYYIDVINNRAAYLFANHVLPGDELAGLNTGLSAVGTQIADGVNCEYIDVKSYTLQYGVDNFNVSLGELQDSYNRLTTEALPNLDYVLAGPSLGTQDDTVAKHNFIISVVEERKDCIAFLSAPRYAIIGQPDAETITDNIVEWAQELSSTSYAVLDSGYKYMYDRFNDRYRYVPLNGDIAGLMVNTSLTAEPWYSPAGLSRGQIRNVVKLPYNPTQKQRDELYPARVNPVVSFPGEGTILFGDKTALGYSSAFDRINVRKLFLVIEKEIAKIARTSLFEFNDDVTRSLFKNNVNPFLRDVQAKRGMYDFLVVCDQTNNTPEVIDRNEFIADIYIKPAKSINFITLNFIATKTGVTFDESVGLFRGS